MDTIVYVCERREFKTLSEAQQFADKLFQRDRTVVAITTRKKRARKSSTTQTSALTLASFVVRAARGHQKKDGGVVWSGVLWCGDVAVAEFRNEGDGGCNIWRVRDERLFEEFKAAAKREREENFEQEDHAVGALWDFAMTNTSTMGAA